MPEPSRVPNASPDAAAERLAALRALIPEAISDGLVDAEALALAVGLPVANRWPERFGLSWSGKVDALQLAGSPSRATLLPDVEASVGWANTGHAIIEGDNLETLKLLSRGYFGRVKMIYIDPPYNTGHDFVYPDNYHDPLETYLRLTGQTDADGNMLTTNSEGAGRFHSSWLTMLYPRLLVARRLLRDDGVIIVSIDDHEAHHLRVMMDEIFGEEHFVGQLIWKRRQNVDSRTKTGLSVDHEYALIYRRSNEGRIRGGDKDLTKYANPDDDPRGPWLSADMTGLATQEQRPNLHYPLKDPATGYTYAPSESGWRYSPSTMAKLIEQGRILFPNNPTGRPRLKKFLNELLDEFTGLSTIVNSVHNAQGTRELKELFDGAEVFDFPKPVEYVKQLVRQATKPDEQDIILDFFAGSGTTAQAVLELNQEDDGNRRFILVQLPEPIPGGRFTSIAAITRERVRRAIARIKQGQNGMLLPPTADLGFRAFALAPSRIRQWEPVEEVEAAIEQMAFLAESPLIPGWKPNDLIAEIALKEGFSLAYQVEAVDTVPGSRVYQVVCPEKEQTFHICLDDSLPDDLPYHLGLAPSDPFVCLDSALDDTKAMNFALQSDLRTV